MPAPLQTQQVEVKLGKLDQKTSDKLAVAGTLTTCENAEVIATGRYQRRPGTVVFDTLVGTARLHNGQRELLVGTATTVYSDLDGALAARGVVAGFATSHVPVNNTQFAQSNHDHARAGGLDWHTWEESTGIFYCVRDATTGAYLVVDTLIDPSGTHAMVRPRVVATATHAMFTWVEVTAPSSWTLWRLVFPVATPAVATSAAVAIATGLWGATDPATGNGGGNGYDIAPMDGVPNTFGLAYVMGGATFDVTIKKIEVQSTGTVVTSSVTITGAALWSVFLRYSLAFIEADTTGFLVLGAHENDVTGANNKTHVSVYQCNAALGATARVDIFTAAADTDVYMVDNVAGFVDAAGTWHLLVSMLTQTSSDRPQIWYWQRTSGAVLTGPGVRFGVRLASKPFVLGGTNLVMLAGIVKNLPPAGSGTLLETATNFIMQIQTGAEMGRALPAIATSGPVRARWGQTTTVYVSGSLALWSGVYFSTGVQLSATLVSIFMQPTSRWLEVAGVTLIPGSTIHLYDGIGISELGFHFPPGIIAQASAAGGSLATADYFYSATYAWVDAAGRLHRSAPSDPVKVSIGGGPKKAQITLSTLNLTLKSTPVPQAAVELWRTPGNPSAAGAAAMYLVLTVPNDPTIGSFVVEDTLADAVLITNEQLYTLANAVLPNTTPPPANGLCAWGGRAWAWERDVLWFSKLIADDFGVFFTDEQFVQITDAFGDLVAAADAGPSLAVFKKQAIYTLSGSGPGDTGQGSFSPIRRIPVPLGARSAVSVVSTELGVFFQDDASGQIWLLEPSGGTSFVGVDVSMVAPTLTITDAVVVPDKRHVRFCSLEGTTLVYDLTHQQWTTYTGQLSVANAEIGGSYYYATPTGVICHDDPETFLEGDNGAGGGVPYRMALETSWLAVNQIAGYQRVYATQIQGEELGEHDITIGMGYRYGTVEEQRVLSSSILNDAFGYRVEARPAIRNQRATSIKLRLEDDAPATPGLAVDAIALTVGVRPTRERLPRAQIATRTT